MKGIKHFICRLIRDDSGMESVEIAFSVGLIAAIAGFGMVVLGDGLNTFFSSTGSSISTGPIPGCTNSSTISGSC